MSNDEEIEGWDVPLPDETWTIPQLVKYIGLIPNEAFDKNKPEEGLPYLFDGNGFLIQAIREQILSAIRQSQQTVPKIVVPGIGISKQFQSGGNNGR